VAPQQRSSALQVGVHIEGTLLSVIGTLPSIVGPPEQTPAAQVEPAAQTLPHMPQWSARVWVATQAPPQQVRPAAHAGLHALPGPVRLSSPQAATIATRAKQKGIKLRARAMDSSFVETLRSARFTRGPHATGRAPWVSIG
jgi:hypothetical protein